MSGIYIPGMEMPMCCQDCLFNYHAVCVIATGTPRPHVEFNKRRDNCPLVPVPDHGRLVDADAEWAEIKRIYDKAVAKDPEMPCVNVYEGEMAAFELAKTIIPAELVSDTYKLEGE